MALLMVAILTGCSGVETQETTKWLYWTAPGDDGSVGQAFRYEMRRSGQPINESNWASAELVANMPAPSMAGQTDSVEIAVGPNEVVFVRVITCDESGNCAGLSNEASIDFFPPDVITDLRFK